VSVTLDVASSVANYSDVIMRTSAVGVSRAGIPALVANDIIMIIAGRRHGDWRHVATGSNALVSQRRTVEIYALYVVIANKVKPRDAPWRVLWKFMITCSSSTLTQILPMSHAI